VAKGVKLGVGKAWISLDSLVRIQTYQWVTSDFLRNFFHARSWSSDRVEPLLSDGRSAVHTTRAIRRQDIPGVEIKILSFNLRPVVRQSQSPSILRPLTVSGKILSVILISRIQGDGVDGAAAQRFRRGQFAAASLEARAIGFGWTAPAGWAARSGFVEC
jgi:hypothetical protein